jgi:hypothetical protein
MTDFFFPLGLAKGLEVEWLSASQRHQLESRNLRDINYVGNVTWQQVSISSCVQPLKVEL